MGYPQTIVERIWVAFTAEKDSEDEGHKAEDEGIRVIVV